MNLFYGPKTKLSPAELSARRAQEYPEVLDDYGRPFWVGFVEQRDDKIARLEEEIAELKAATKTAIPQPQTTPESAS